MADHQETLGEVYPRRSSTFGAASPSSREQRRSILKNVPIQEFSETYDYVIVFPMADKDDTGQVDYDESQSQQQTNVAKHCMSAIVSRGLEIFPFLSVQGDELYVLIRCPGDILRRFADKVDWLIQADEVALDEYLRSEIFQNPLRPEGIVINDDKDITPYSPYQYIYLPYEREVPQQLYKVPDGCVDPFTKSTRLKLIYALLRAPGSDFGCQLELSKLLYKKKILALFPLHEHNVREQLIEKITAWSTFPWDAPTHDLKEYFGEKIALYTVFLGHYSWWLVVPSIIGFIFQLVVWGTVNFSHPVLPFYSLIITVWSICMLEYWKRQEATTAMLWGMSYFESLEQGRPEYVGYPRKSHINGLDIAFYPPAKVEFLQVVSRAIVGAFILLVIGVVASIYILRFQLQQRQSTNFISSYVASILNAIQIQIFNFIYQIIAISLTNNENHRTDTLYEDSLITKLFIFQFINSYSSFFFLAFIASYLERPVGADDDQVGQCAASTCMQPLSINLAIIFGTRLTVQNVVDVAVPYIMKALKRRTETKGIEEGTKLTDPEEDYLLMQYKAMIESIRNYADTAIQYGYTMLFITALPIALFFSLVNNYAKVKFDMYKLFNYYQRPVPNGAQDIGSWMGIFQFISVAAVITNAGLVVFTMDLDTGSLHWSLANRLWVFVGFQWVLVFIQFIATEIIDDIPAEVTIQLERMDFIKSKAIDGVPDEIDDDVDFEEEENPEGEDLVDNRCCQACRVEKPKVSGAKRIVKNIGAFPIYSYPENNEPSNWPPPLDRQNDSVPDSIFMTRMRERQQARLAVEQQEQQKQYASSYPAMANPADQPPRPPPAADEQSYKYI